MLIIQVGRSYRYMIGLRRKPVPAYFIQQVLESGFFLESSATQALSHCFSDPAQKWWLNTQVTGNKILRNLL